MPSTGSSRSCSTARAAACSACTWSRATRATSSSASRSACGSAPPWTSSPRCTTCFLPSAKASRPRRNAPLNDTKETREAGAGYRPLSRDPSRPCWRTASAGNRAPGGRGRIGRSARWLPSQLDGHGSMLVAAVDAELHLVTGLLVADCVAELLDRVERNALDGVDQVTAERIGDAREGRALSARAQSRLGGRTTGLHRLDEQAVARGEAEELGGGVGHGLRGDPEEGVFRMAGPDDLRGDGLDGVDRDRETDAHVSLGARLTGLNL